MFQDILPNLITAVVAALAVFFMSKDRRAREADGEADRLITHLKARVELVEKDRDDCRKLIATQAIEVKELREKLAYLEGLIRGRDEIGSSTGEIPTFTNRSKLRP